MYQQLLFNTMKNNKKDLKIRGLNKGKHEDGIFTILYLLFIHNNFDFYIIVITVLYPLSRYGHHTIAFFYC